MAAGAVVVRGVDAGDAVEHVAGLGGTLAFELFAADHVAGAGVFEYVGLCRIAEPVADHAGSTQLNSGRCAGRLHAVGVVALGACLQAGAFQQFLQAVGGAVVAGQAATLQAGGDLGAERNQRTSFAAKLIERRLKGGGGDVIRLGLGRHHRRQHRQAEAGAEQQLAQRAGEKGGLLGHEGRS